MLKYSGFAALKPGVVTDRTVFSLLGRLRSDASGNTLAMIAAALVPLLAMVGGGIDMGRSYLSQTRLQQACDAGVLAARKRLGSQVVLNGTIPQEVEDVGNRFFNINFGNGSYGTSERAFQMTLESDFAISGVATVKVPTTIMKVFGYTNVDIAVDCQAKLNFSNTDIMFVLDTTGSMNNANPGDSETKIQALRRVVKDFHTQIEGSKSPGTRVRYGFVPYSTNVNVGPLLKSDWVVDSWVYQSRKPKYLGDVTWDYYSAVYDVRSGTQDPIATFTSATCPDDTLDVAYGPTTTISSSPDSYWYDATKNGIDYVCTGSDGNWTVSGTEYVDQVTRETWTYDHTGTEKNYTFVYQPVSQDVRSLKGATGNDPVHNGAISTDYLLIPNNDGTPQYFDTWFTGCIEERGTYEIDDYANVDLSRALDLDIDTVPTPGNPETQWRPMLMDSVFDRSVWWNGQGAFTPQNVEQRWDYLQPYYAGFASCPTQAHKLTELSSADVESYLDSMEIGGSTYHDIGMIWGARLLSPTGLFASENADVNGKPTSRNLIFLTDGETAPLDVSYGAYGVEPLDGRRWTPTSPDSLTETVEKRFSVACEEAKKRNITVWVVGFGVTLNPIMTDCAGAGHHYEAADAAQLEDVFSKIASQLGDLRVSK